MADMGRMVYHMNEMNDHQKHWNLYHILHSDKLQHPMPSAFWQKLQQLIEELIHHQKIELRPDD